MRDELARQLSRRRTRWVLVATAVVPVVLALVFAVRGAPQSEPGTSPQLVHLADGSAIAFTLFVLYMCAPLLLVVVASLFAGDAVAGEAAWGTLRYLLAAPVPRRVLLARKLVATLVLTVLALAAMTGVSLFAGWAAFGWGAVETPVGGTIEPGAALGRLMLACAYIFVTLLPFVSIALLLSTRVEAPLVAVGGAVGVAVISQIIDVVPTLGDARAVLPTHYALEWLDLFVDPPDPLGLAPGILQAAVMSVAALVAAWWHFSRRDVMS